jgi:uncharacterized membrane protein
VIAPPPITSKGRGRAVGWADDWLPAADLSIGDADGEGLPATISFDRDGRCQLQVALGRPATPDDVRALEAAAGALPYLQLDDLEGTEDYPQRHAAAFGLPDPLPPSAFNPRAQIALTCRPGGTPLPTRLGNLEVPARTTFVPPPPLEPGGTGPAERAGTGGGGAGELLDAAWSRLEAQLVAAGRGVVRLTSVPAATLCLAVVGFALALFVFTFVLETWTLHQRFGTYGFDLGIFDQGTWLLSRFHAPFVTIRGLDMVGDHASYILLLVAPLYRVWADPRLLLLLQVVALALPAWVLFRLGTRHLGHPVAGMVVALAYLAYPGMQWAATWQFHPETLAAGFLALGALAADRQRWRQMAMFLALAMLCKEDVGLVVAGLGVLLALSGERRVGLRVAGAGLAWFALATFVLIPLVNGHGSPYFAQNYGIAASGPWGVLRALPALAGRSLETGLGNQGIGYLLLVFGPLALLPLLAPRWLWPVAPPLLLNLASVSTYLQQIRFQYLATSAPFLGIATVAGLCVIARRRRALLAPAMVVLLVAAFWSDRRYGPALWSRTRVVAPASAVDPARRQALQLVPGDPGVAVSAQYNLVTHLAHRVRAYEFPNPFRASNWGQTGARHTLEEVTSVHWVVVERDELSQDDLALLQRLQASPAWSTRLDRDGVVVLERVAPGGPGP